MKSSTRITTAFCCLIAAVMSAAGCGYLSASGPAAKIVKENAARTKRFHELNDRVTNAQLVLQNWLTGEVKKCDAEGQLHPPAKGLKMTLHFSQQAADLVCEAQPDPAQQQAAKPPTPPAAPPVPAGKK